MAGHKENNRGPMRTVKAIFLIFTFCGNLVIGHVSAWASAGTSGAAFLKEPLSPSVVAIGGTFLGINPEVDGVYYNPSAIAGLPHTSLSLGWNKLIAGTVAGYGLIGIPLGKKPEGFLSLNPSIGITLQYLGTGNAELNYLDDTGHFASRETVQAESDYLGGITLALEPQLPQGKFVDMLAGRGVAAGGTLKYFASTLAEKYSASTVSLDLGVLSRNSKDMTFGLAMTNIGFGLKFAEVADPLPLGLRLSAAKRFAFGPDHLVGCGTNVQWLNDSGFMLNVGGEYEYAGMLAVRAGLKYGYKNFEWTGGFGWKKGNFGIDWSIGIVDWLWRHRVALNYKFGVSPTISPAPKIRQRISEKELEKLPGLEQQVGKPPATPKVTPIVTPEGTQEKCSIHGIVTGPDGQPVVTAWVKLTEYGKEIKRVATDGSGKYEFTRLEPGEYRLKVWKSASLLPRYADVSLSSGQIIPVDFELLDTHISGMVTNPSGEPLPYAAIKLSDEKGELFRVYTAGDGHFRTRAVLPGNYVIKAWMEGYHPQEKTILATISGPVKVDFNITPK